MGIDLSDVFGCGAFAWSLRSLRGVPWLPDNSRIIHPDIAVRERYAAMTFLGITRK